MAPERRSSSRKWKPFSMASVGEMGHLRQIREDEVELMLEWRNAPSVRMHMYNQDEIPRQIHFDWWERTKQQDDCQYFMYENDQTPLGIVAFNSINRKQANSSWAFYAATDAPRGTGSQMEFLALDHAFGVLNLHKLHCEVLSSNRAVVRLHEKFGFRIEGVFREQFFLREEFIDIIRLGILRAEWDAARPRLLETLSRHKGGA